MTTSDTTSTTDTNGTGIPGHQLREVRGIRCSCGAEWLAGDVRVHPVTTTDGRHFVDVLTPDVIPGRAAHHLAQVLDAREPAVGAQP